MTVEQHQQEIKELFLSRIKTTHKVQDRIELFQILVQEAEKYSLPAYAACFSGYLALAKKDFDQAITNFQEATRLDEALAYAWNGLGMVYRRLKDYEKAKECIEKATQLDEGNAVFWNDLGILFVNLKDYTRATECFEKAKHLDESWAYPWNNLGNLYKRGDNEQAKKYYEKAIQLDESWAYPWNNLGDLYRLLKDNDKAKDCYEKAIQLDKSYAVPWNKLGILYRGLKDYEKSKRCFDKAIELQPDDPTFHFNLSLVLFDQDKFSEAEEHLQKAEAGYSREKNEYFLARTKDLLAKIKELQDSEKHAAQKSTPSTPLENILIATMRRNMAEEAIRNQQSFHQFLKEPDDRRKPATEDYLLILRRWNSYTPIVADNFHISKGGGYFLKVNHKGIIIDPGFNFIDNFRAAGRFFHEIDAVLVSHAHNDHTADLESILTLLDRYNKEIKDSSDPAKETTIRREIAQQQGIEEHKVSKEEIDKVFLSSDRRKIIDFYLTASVFKKYGGWFDLFSKNDYRLHIVEPGDTKNLIGGIKVHFLYAKHEDIISDQNSVGFYLQFQDDLVIIYTGDTGWNNRIEQQYQKVAQDFLQEYRLLLAHLGGVKKEEALFLSESEKEKAFYPDHLGRLGLARINEVLRPQLCIISEFGEELREWRQDLADIYQEAFDHKVLFIPGDIGLKFDLKTRKVWAIKKIDIKTGELISNYIDPKLVSSVLLRKDFSLHFYNRKANFKKEDLVQFLADQFDNIQK